MAEAVGAVFDDDILVCSVSRTAHRVVGPRSLAAFHRDGVVVHLHMTTADVDIAHDIEIDGIGRWSHRVVGASKTEKRHATDAQVLATVEMRSPVGAVLQPDILYAYVAAIRDI